MNYLKNNYMIKKDRKIVLSYFNSRQSLCRQLFLQHLIEKNKGLKDREISIVDFGLSDSGLKNRYMSESTVVFKELSPIGSDKPITDEINSTLSNKSKRNVVILLGLEIVLNLLGKEKGIKLINSLKSESLDKSIRSLHILCFPDQLVYKSIKNDLQSIINFLFDFQNVSDFVNFTLPVVNFHETAIISKEIVSGTFKDGQVYLKKYVPENTVIEEKNPDELIKTTFKLGINENNKSNKEKMILPYFQEKQIKEMKERITVNDSNEEEEINLGVDDEELDLDEDVDV